MSRPSTQEVWHSLPSGHDRLFSIFVKVMSYDWLSTGTCVYVGKYIHIETRVKHLLTVRFLHV